MVANVSLRLTPAATAGKIGAAFGTKGVTLLTVRLPALVKSHCALLTFTTGKSYSVGLPTHTSNTPIGS